MIPLPILKLMVSVDCERTGWVRNSVVLEDEEIVSGQGCNLNKCKETPIIIFKEISD